MREASRDARPTRNGGNRWKYKQKWAFDSFVAQLPQWKSEAGHIVGKWVNKASDYLLLCPNSIWNWIVNVEVCSQNWMNLNLYSIEWSTRDIQYVPVLQIREFVKGTEGFKKLMERLNANWSNYPNSANFAYAQQKYIEFSTQNLLRSINMHSAMQT